jgi:hypothetical protein
MRSKPIIVKVIVSLFAVVSLLTFIARGEPAQTTSEPAVATLSGMQTGPAPWLPEIKNLRARLKAINLPALSAEGEELHIHQHLDIFVNGKPATVPAGIGINMDARFISQLHTHDVSGVIHIESDQVRDFTLGQFFDVWGVRFTKDCIGGYCTKGNDKLRVFSDGKPVTADPANLVLSSHQVIAVVFGPVQSTPTIRTTYQFDD